MRDQQREAIERSLSEETAGAVDAVDGRALDRLHVGQALASAIENLEAPYRTALVLRYLEGLDTQEIARRTCVPAGTVRQRVSRGLKILRERLDRRFGDRDDWVLALAPWAPFRGGPLVAGLAAIAVVSVGAVALSPPGAHGVVAGPATVTPLKPRASGAATRLAMVEPVQTRIEAMEGPPSLAPIASAQAHVFSAPQRPSQHSDAKPSSGAVPVEWPRKQLLAVDATTGAPLSRVEVFALFPYFVRPGEPLPWGVHAEKVATDASSIVTLGSSKKVALGRIQNVLVGAEGYAWTRVVLNMESGGERTVELVPGGALEVEVQGTRARGLNLRLYREGWTHPVRDVELRGHYEATFEALEPVDYTVKLESDRVSGGVHILAMDQIRVEAGLKTTHRLTVEPAVAPMRAPVSGVITIPEAWGIEDAELRIRRLHDPEWPRQVPIPQAEPFADPDPDVPGKYGFAVRLLPVGSYSISIPKIGWMATFELPAAGARNLEFFVPQPVKVTVHVTESVSGAPLPPRSATWCTHVPVGARGGHPVQWSNPDGRHELKFRLAEGPGLLRVSHPDYASAELVFDARDGAHLALGMAKGSRASVLVLDGDRRVPWPTSHRFDLEPVDGGEGRLCFTRQGGDAAVFGVTTPGRYRLNFPEFNGYEPVPPMEFEMLAAQTIELLVELQGK